MVLQLMVIQRCWWVYGARTAMHADERVEWPNKLVLNNWIKSAFSKWIIIIWRSIFTMKTTEESLPTFEVVFVLIWCTCSCWRQWGYSLFHGLSRTAVPSIAVPMWHLRHIGTAVEVLNFTSVTFGASQWNLQCGKQWSLYFLYDGSRT